MQFCVRGWKSFVPIIPEYRETKRRVMILAAYNSIHEYVCSSVSSIRLNYVEYVERPPTESLFFKRKNYCESKLNLSFSIVSNFSACIVGVWF